MKFDVPEDYVPLVIRALEHYQAYLVATSRSDSRYTEAAEFFKGRKGPGREEGKPESKKKTG